MNIAPNSVLSEVVIRPYVDSDEPFIQELEDQSPQGEWIQFKLKLDRWKDRVETFELHSVLVATM